MLWRIRWEDLQFESPNKYHKRAGSRLTLSQVDSLLRRVFFKSRCPTVHCQTKHVNKKCAGQQKKNYPLRLIGDKKNKLNAPPI